MLNKIIQITNVGKFRNCHARGDVEFKKLTLIYAENGRGKTTFSDVIRSLKTGLPDFILGRHTLGTPNPSEVQLRIDNNNASFTNGNWNITYPNIAIFDSHFVHENIFAGDFIDHEHKKNLYRVIVSEEGVRLAHRVDDLDAQIRATNTRINNAKAELQNHIPQGFGIDTFIGLQRDDEIDSKIQAKITELTSLSRAQEIATKNFLGQVTLPSLPDTFANVLSRQLGDVSTEAETRVHQQVGILDNQGETWLSQGLGYCNNELCPFCGQDVSDNDLIVAFRAYFSEAYRDHRQTVFNMKSLVERNFSDSALLSLQRVISDNIALLQFWQQFMEVPNLELSFEIDLQPAIDELRSKVLDLLSRKILSPLDSLEPGEEFQDAQRVYREMSTSVHSYNTAVEALNILIQEKKTSTATGDVRQLQSELVMLNAIKHRHTPEIVTTCDRYTEEMASKTALEEEKERAKEQLDNYSTQILTQYQTRINDLLARFNAGFRLTETTRRYVGGTVSTYFQLLINDTPFDVGDTTTPLGTPCFKNTLSAGDRSTLALAFFLTQLQNDQNLSNKIVVFDDPFSSLDRFRRKCTQELVCGTNEAAVQVVVLSHDPAFLKLIWDAVPTANIKTLQFARAGNDTAITEWDIEKETQASYLQDLEGLIAFVRDGTGQLRDIARKIRPVLEGFLRLRYPGHFCDGEWLGNFIQKIRDADASSSLVPVKNILSELTSINDYSKKYHHEQNPGGADTEPIDDCELEGYVKRALAIVGGY